MGRDGGSCHGAAVAVFRPQLPNDVFGVGGGDGKLTAGATVTTTVSPAEKAQHSLGETAYLCALSKRQPRRRRWRRPQPRSARLATAAVRGAFEHHHQRRAAMPA